jgi:hypothetical protein
MISQAESRFALTAADTAMRAAVASLRKRNVLPCGDAELDKMIEILRRETRSGIEVAFNDAKAAGDAGMWQVASATFAASMAVIGVKAADAFATWKAGK